MVNTLLSSYLDANTLIPDRVHSVVQLFEQQFGVDHVDVQKELTSDAFSSGVSFEKYISQLTSYSIIIKIDSETVTNELGQHTRIYDLFIKIPLRTNGTMRDDLQYIRSTFTRSQFKSGYVHSHCWMLRKDELDKWGSVCFGTGPIRYTVRALNSDYDINRWMGMIAELRQIVRVESLAGGPYIKLSTIQDGFEELKSFSVALVNKKLKPLIKSYIRSGRTKWGFIGYNYCLGTTFVEWLIDFTAYYKEYKKHFPNTPNIIKPTYIRNNKVFVQSGYTTPIDYNQYIGKHVLFFKGEDIKLNILDSEDDVQKLDLVDYNIGASILNHLLNTLNAPNS